MTGRLEDVLGGVEDEIRRAEERLQLDVFSGADFVYQNATQVGMLHPCVETIKRQDVPVPHRKKMRWSGNPRSRTDQI